MKTTFKKNRPPWLLTLLLFSSLIFLNFNKQESRNGTSLDAISKSNSFYVSSYPLRSISLNNNLSISKQVSSLINTNQVVSGKGRTDTLDVSNKNEADYNSVGSNNIYKQLKANSLFNNQAVIQFGDSNYAGNLLLNSSMTDLVIRSIGNKNTVVQNILNGYNNSLIIIQNGSSNATYQDIAFGSLTNEDNTSNLLQTRYNNWIKSSQAGQNNSFDAIQNGDSNRVSIKQNGKNNKITIRQSGNKNMVQINQN